MSAARIWVLLYSRTGDNNQVLSLAQSLGQPFETKQLKYNLLRGFGLHLGPSLLTIDKASRKSIRPPWPDLILAIGRWSVPVARAIKSKSQGRSKILFLGNPRIDPHHFDLILATRDYLDPRGENVVVVPLPMALPAASADPAGEPIPFAGLPHPRTLFLIGAPIKYWDLSESYLRAAVLQAVGKANAAGGSILVSGSPRTPDALLDAASLALAEARNGWMARSRRGGLDQLFAAVDEVVVTGDSMSMVTEAVLTGKPVGILPLELSEKGLRKLGPQAAESRSGSKRRDLRRFWAEIWDRGLAGTVAHPKAARLASSAASAALIVASFLSLSQLPEGAPGPLPEDTAETGLGKPAVKGVTGFLSIWHGLENLLDAGQRDAGALWLATWDSQTPWYAKLIAGIVSASAMSPIDLTPDFIPVIGYLDDLMLMALGTYLAARLIPRPLLADFRQRAMSLDYSAARRGVIVMVGIWTAAAATAILRLAGFSI